MLVTLAQEWGKKEEVQRYPQHVSLFSLGYVGYCLLIPFAMKKKIIAENNVAVSGNEDKLNLRDALKMCVCRLHGLDDKVKE